MKARVKATGEIVEVQRLCMSSEGDIYQSGTGQEYLVWMLDFDFKEEPTPKYIPDYWTRLEHQAAIAAMQGILSNQDYCKLLIDENNKGSFAEDVSRCASDFAHALVEKYKEKEV